MRYNTIITIALLGFELLLGARDRQEGLLLLTDRGHYISGETIHYRAFYMEPGESGQSSWSKILYVELILPNGTPLAQGKVSIDTAGAIGSIAIQAKALDDFRAGQPALVKCSEVFHYQSPRVTG